MPPADRDNQRLRTTPREVRGVGLRPSAWGGGGGCVNSPLSGWRARARSVTRAEQRSARGPPPAAIGSCARATESMANASHRRFFFSSSCFSCSSVALPPALSSRHPGARFPECSSLHARRYGPHPLYVIFIFDESSLCFPSDATVVHCQRDGSFARFFLYISLYLERQRRTVPAAIERVRDYWFVSFHCAGSSPSGIFLLAPTDLLASTLSGSVYIVLRLRPTRALASPAHSRRLVDADSVHPCPTPIFLCSFFLGSFCSSSIF